MLLVSQIVLFDIVNLFKNWKSSSYFYNFFPFNLCDIIKYLTTYSDIELQFSDFLCPFITLYRVLCTSSFSFQIEELLSTFLVRKVLCWWIPSAFVCLGKPHFSISEWQLCWIGTLGWQFLSFNILSMSFHFSRPVEFLLRNLLIT